MEIDQDQNNPTIQFDGQILYLTANTDLIRDQLDGTRLEWNESVPLLDNISTDEITPAWVCFHYDETLGEYVHVGIRGGPVRQGDILNADISVIVSGLSKGCGSSRETAPYAEKWAGVQLIVAHTIEKIYGQNCQNIGLLTTTDFGILDRIQAGEAIPLSEFTQGLDPISSDIVRCGGLFAYNEERLAGRLSPPPIQTPHRPLNLVEKIIAKHAIADAKSGRTGIDSVQPGDALFVRSDIRFSHEYVTPMAWSLLQRHCGDEAKVNHPESVYAFRDHLTFLGDVMSDERKQMGLLDKADGLASTQEDFARSQGVRLYGEVEGGGSEAICHNAVLEDIVLPGQIVIGSDSHTCTAGAMGAFAFGVGSTDLAASWCTRDIRVKVPEVVRYRVSGLRRWDITAKDIMLHILATDYCRAGRSIGKVLFFQGESIRALSMDERATLTNMAVEGGATTGIIEADDKTLQFLADYRGLDPESIRSQIVNCDPDATYGDDFEILLDDLRPMVATPGDPRNGVPIDQIPEKTRIGIAYAGSCTGGKMADMDMYAAVLVKAESMGLRVHENVHFYIQFGSQRIKDYARGRGYIELFERVGAELINPSCGACINAGPGSSRSKDEVTISSQNRNFPGRSGPGQVYLASPYVVAASAIAGHITSPCTYLEPADVTP